MLNKSALDLERKDAKKKRTSNPDPGFKSWEDNTSRQYMRLTRGKILHFLGLMTAYEATQFLLSWEY